MNKKIQYCKTKAEKSFLFRFCKCQCMFELRYKELMTMFKEILKASRNNRASIFAFTFKFELYKVFIIIFVAAFYYIHQVLTEGVIVVEDTIGNFSTKIFSQYHI